MRNLMVGSVIMVMVVSLMGCTIAIGPPYGLQSGVRGYFGPGPGYSSGYGYGYNGYNGYRGGYGGHGTRWVPGHYE